MRLPQNGISTPFQIGVRPLDVADWIDVDDQLDAYLSAKARLVAAHPSETFAAEPGTEDAQAEVRDLLVAYLPERFPDVYRRDGTAMLVAGRRIDLLAEPPLRTAALMVQEDLVLMRKGIDGWRLAAASLSFPSSWKLADKFGKPMHAVHAPVPGFTEGTRNAGMIERMFDHLRPEMPVLRWNWSLFSDLALYHPEPSHPIGPRFGATGEKAVLRIERQTLRRLPQSGDILFTIRIYVDSLSALERHSDGASVAGAMIAQLSALTEEQAAYKGLAADRAILIDRLKTIANRPA
jgi:hypothetical protein